MAFIPLSLILELILIFLGLLLMEYKIVGRMGAMACYIFAIRYVTDTQVYIVETAGVITSPTAAYPTAILAPFVFMLTIFLYMSLVSAFEYVDRDMFGRSTR